MGAEIGLVSMTQIQKLSQSQHHKNHPHPPPSPPPPPPQQNPNTTTTTTAWATMWNPKDSNQEDDDSWEVRAFAEDTRNIMGTTWPPRSYTCTFCAREFRSAQALGGHMNVHRRDRARLHHQAPPPHQLPGGGSVTPTLINVPAAHQEVVANAAGLCFLYHLPSPNSTTTTTFHSSLLSSSSSSSSPHYPPNNNSLMMQPYLSSAAAAAVGINGVSSSSYNYCCNSNKVVVEQPLLTSSSVNNGLHLEELDLELRLGHKPTPTS